MSDLYSVVFKLLTLGFSVLPSGGGEKHKAPLVPWREYQNNTPDENQLEAWEVQFKPRLWGIVTNERIAVIDADTPEAKAQLEAEIGEPHVTTPSEGAHWYLNTKGHPFKTVTRVLPGVDIRGAGGFANIAGDGYQIRRMPVPGENLISWQNLPARILNSLKDNTTVLRVEHGDPIPEGTRNAAMASLAGSMRSKGMSKEAISAALSIENRSRCSTPLPEAEIESIAKSISRYEPSAPSSQPKPAASWPDSLDREAFHGLAGDVVRAIDPHTESDQAAILTNFLIFLGNALGPVPFATAEADRHGCNLFCVQVGETAKGRKGSGYGQIRELFSRVDSVWTDNCNVSGLSSGEGVIWAVRDRVEKTQKGEPVVMDEGTSDKRLLITEPEFASALKIMAREGNTLSAVIRQAWDSGTLRTLTKNSPVKATGAHISILGHVTKQELLRYLNDIEAGNGFANRFLWVCVRRSKVLPEGGKHPNYSLIVPRLHDALLEARKLGIITRDDEARKMWAEIYPELSNGEPGLFGAVTARSEAQVLRLSVLYAALDGDSCIQRVHLMAALAVWDYCLASARYIFGDALGDPVADRIQGELRQGRELTRTVIYGLFNRHISAQRIDNALQLLLATKRAQCKTISTEGRPVEVWYTI